MILKRGAYIALLSIALIIAMGGTPIVAQSLIITTSPVAGVAFQDLNRDGQYGFVQGNAEPGLQNAQIVLWQDRDLSGDLTPADAQVAFTWTGYDGTFVFSSVPPGTYVVTFDAPKGFVVTTPLSYALQVVEGGLGGTEVAVYFGATRQERPRRFQVFMPFATTR